MIVCASCFTILFIKEGVMVMTKVYIAGAIPEVGLNLLKEHFEVDMYDGEGLIDKETLKRGRTCRCIN